MEIKEIRKKLQEKLTPKRFEHTKGVEYTCATLAWYYDVDMNKAMLAGLLHDCAKYLNNDKKVKYAEKYNLEINEYEYKNPQLLHAKLGAYFAQHEYDVVDEDILNAICYHVTGRENMSVLEKIVFVADYIEPNRNEAPNLLEIRQLAFKDLNQCIVKIIEDTINYLKDKACCMDMKTIETYEFYKRLN